MSNDPAFEKYRIEHEAWFHERIVDIAQAFFLMFGTLAIFLIIFLMTVVVVLVKS